MGCRSNGVNMRTTGQSRTSNWGLQSNSFLLLAANSWATVNWIKIENLLITNKVAATMKRWGTKWWKTNRRRQRSLGTGHRVSAESTSLRCIRTWTPARQRTRRWCPPVRPPDSPSRSAHERSDGSSTSTWSVVHLRSISPNGRSLQALGSSTSFRLTLRCWTLDRRSELGSFAVCRSWPPVGESADACSPFAAAGWSISCRVSTVPPSA